MKTPSLLRFLWVIFFVNFLLDSSAASKSPQCRKATAKLWKKLDSANAHHSGYLPYNCAARVDKSSLELVKCDVSDGVDGGISKWIKAHESKLTRLALRMKLLDERQVRQLALRVSSNLSLDPLLVMRCLNAELNCGSPPMHILPTADSFKAMVQDYFLRGHELVIDPKRLDYMLRAYRWDEVIQQANQKSQKQWDQYSQKVGKSGLPPRIVQHLCNNQQIWLSSRVTKQSHLGNCAHFAAALLVAEAQKLPDTGAIDIQLVGLEGGGKVHEHWITVINGTPCDPHLDMEDFEKLGWRINEVVQPYIFNNQELALIRSKGNDLLDGLNRSIKKRRERFAQKTPPQHLEF